MKYILKNGKVYQNGSFCVKDIFVNNGIIADIKSELKKTENTGKGIKDIFETLTKDKQGIFENPNKPADMPGMGESGQNVDNGADGFVSIIQEAQRK